ncbi:kinase-like domain-containing protein [Pilobolus umbonatus]|nr:kinase-like domain-containing protein [Pilobolus umbonatus]
MVFLHRSKFMYHGYLTSSSCMITGRWELKISNYGLLRVRGSQSEAIDTLPTSTKKDISTSSFLDDIPRVIKTPDVLLWLAPESVIATQKKIHMTIPSKQADVFSAGIVINEILTREKPYQEHTALGIDSSSIFLNVCGKGLRPAMNEVADDAYMMDMNSIVADCLEGDPEERPSFSSINVRNLSIDFSE